MRQTNIRYLGNQEQFEDSALAPSSGGNILAFKASGTLKVADAVQLSAANAVVKATTNPTKVIGIVVGGASLPDGNVYEEGSATSATLIAAGVTAATDGQQVLVMILGVFRVVADGAISPGGLIKISGTTAGQVTAATADTDAGSIVGRFIDTATVNAGDTGKAVIFLA